ncbi:hypothetical protein [Listeria fleischmannii]|uniref:Uncharacterized protein n=1 Tax=Listeria fleischmannii FSL S10-1203 TaxID=1265822 RepID=W7DJS5_9LIST|nr:hypothetical protein [Listeria fleischmannii]EUJ47649.1 hypothetical protein MCOL2_18054 [Listeria fleischmannii FSL S10-1203]
MAIEIKPVLVNKLEFNIHGTTLEMRYNDEILKKITTSDFKVMSLTEKLSFEKNKDKSPGEIKKKVIQLYDDIKKERIAFFDDVFGEGVGEALYKQCNNSTTALTSIFDQIKWSIERLAQFNEELTQEES